VEELAPRLEGSGQPGTGVPHECAQPPAQGKDGGSAPPVISGAAKPHTGQAKALSQVQGAAGWCLCPPPWWGWGDTAAHPQILYGQTDASRTGEGHTSAQEQARRHALANVPQMPAAPEPRPLPQPQWAPTAPTHTSPHQGPKAPKAQDQRKLAASPSYH